MWKMKITMDDIISRPFTIWIHGQDSFQRRPQRVKLQRYAVGTTNQSLSAESADRWNMWLMLMAGYTSEELKHRGSSSWIVKKCQKNVSWRILKCSASEWLSTEEVSPKTMWVHRHDSNLPLCSNPICLASDSLCYFTFFNQEKQQVWRHWPPPWMANQLPTGGFDFDESHLSGRRGLGVRVLDCDTQINIWQCVKTLYPWWRSK